MQPQDQLALPLSTHVDEAVRAAGSQQKLAAELGVSQQMISTWRRRGWVPLKRAQEIETLYGIPRAQLINPRVRDLVDMPEQCA